MRVRFYSDENFDLDAVQILRDLGHDVLTAQQAGQANRHIPDPLVLQHAIGEQRVLLTFDNHFKRHHREMPDHFGILLCSNMDCEDLAERIHKAVLQHQNLRGLFLRITRPG